MALTPGGETPTVMQIDCRQNVGWFQSRTEIHFFFIFVGLFFLMSLFSGFQLVEGGSYEGNATDARVPPISWDGYWRHYRRFNHETDFCFPSINFQIYSMCPSSGWLHRQLVRPGKVCLTIPVLYSLLRCDAVGGNLIWNRDSKMLKSVNDQIRHCAKPRDSR